ncbi:MAG: hypothetical protein K9N51_08445, partial [Candidatus Pacebacteria bacterium]|nr:hypothetical protein [Candidatus Paceibacterota bacterium]
MRTWLRRCSGVKQKRIFSVFCKSEMLNAEGSCVTNHLYDDPHRCQSSVFRRQWQRVFSERA